MANNKRNNNATSKASSYSSKQPVNYPSANMEIADELDVQDCGGHCSCKEKDKNNK